ncbi:MAG: orotidine-5'-phosphate decarboxylase [Gammaproteobacteria bacterium]|jgi:orotidine-5'-phosphate decarboxylase
MNENKVIVALDFADAASAREFVNKTSPESCKLKIGKELFTAAGPSLVEEFVNLGYDVFLDLKFHDIPNTVKKAVISATKLGIWMLNVHALGGSDMLKAARDGLEYAGSQRPFLIAVTVLTSLSDQDLQRLGFRHSLVELVNQLADLSIQSGLDGVVCSAHETSTLRQTLGDQALLVTPGIRPEWAANDDQKRIVMPQKAMQDGSSYLVIGRPITNHKNPIEALSLINQSLIS